MNCQTCGFEVPQDADYSFCPKCGSKLDAAEPEVVVQDVPNPAPGEVLLPQMQKLREEIGVAAQSTKKKILIVEDDLFIRELYQKQLTMAGYDVDIAIDGMEGRDKVQANKYDLLLLDIMLPRMNGLDLLKLIKEDEATKDLTVIILSNLGQDSVVEKGLALGAVNYIVKADVTPMEMLKVIEQRIGH